MRETRMQKWMMAVLVGASVLAPVATHAQQPPVDDKYHVTPREKVACTQDAVRLCFGAYPDEDKLIACMKENRSSLTPTCRVAFDAGVRRRHL